ncbi:unnamed protein product [Phaedon cochleariae]|uniref:Uncharacterized protein n=1 Tax=Phaedon cochleariae TaxID=80249 RepID=A0A9N9SJ11_PHACE|nr:unnamed protein product [Phaedon cochleariae]
MNRPISSVEPIWPPNINNLSIDDFQGPKILLTFFAKLLDSTRNEVVIRYIAQDILYAVSCGEFLTPKHLILPLAINFVTGNVEVIKWLNRLAHGCSVTKLLEIDNAWCIEKQNLSLALSLSVPLPSDVHQSIPTVLAFDNIDRLEETLKENRLNYLPTIDSPATEKATVLRILRRSEGIRKYLQIDYIVVVESLDTLVEDQEVSTSDRRPSERNVGLTYYTPKQGRILSRLLTHTHLPGLSSLDQMHLLALADTVSTCDTDLAEHFAIDAAKSRMTHTSQCHPDLRSQRIIRDEKDVTALAELLANECTNPFDTNPSDIVHLSTGISVDASTASDLIDSETEGEKAYQEFTFRLANEEGFHKPIKK